MNTSKGREYSRFARFAYGCADIYGGGAFVIISTFFTVFLTKCLGMSPALAGTIPLIGKIWDAVTDPLMGNIVDRTQSKHGAKRFYILIGSFISAITFVIMWIQLTLDAGMGQYLFYTFMYMIFSTGFTIVMVPYNALLPDMIEDYTVRARFTGTRTMLSTFGAILAGLIPTLLIKDNTNGSAYLKVALIFGVIFFVAIIVTFVGSWEKSKAPVKLRFRDSFAQSFSVYKSRSFRLFIAIFLLGQGAADFVTGLAVYYIDDVLNEYGGGRFTYLMGVLLLSQFFGTIAFTPIITRTSKKFPILVAFPFRILATIVMLFFSYEGVNFGIILVLAFVIGIGMAASTVSIYAILTDMADVDELITSINRPGTCSGMATFVRKIATGCSSAIIGCLLSLVGYDGVIANQGLRQSASTIQGITYIFIFAPLVLMIGTLIVAKLFPVNKEEFQVIKTEIERRKGNDTSVATPEEIKICERVTGFTYDQLWKKENM